MKILIIGVKSLIHFCFRASRHLSSNLRHLPFVPKDFYNGMCCIHSKELYCVKTFLTKRQQCVVKKNVRSFVFEHNGVLNKFGKQKSMDGSCSKNQQNRFISPRASGADKKENKHAEPPSFYCAVENL